MRQTEILVAVRISKSSGRDLLTGIFRFFEENPAWQLHLVQYDEDFTPEIVRGARNLAELRFRQIEGSSIRRMIEDCRLAEVKRLLKRTRLSVTEIAARTGFSGQNRLSHVFKARFGQAPEHWRKKRIP